MAYGSLYNFSLSDFIYDVNIELMMFAIIFLIFTALVRYALVKRIMNDNKTSASIIAICVGLLASYGLVKSGISIQWLTAIHISPEFLVNILPWLILLIAAGIVIKWGFGVLLMIFGAILAIAGFSDLIYARAFGIGVGITLFLIGLALLKKHRKHVARGVGKVGRGAWKGAKYAGSKNYRYQQTKNRRRRKATKRRTKSKKKQDYERHQNAKERLRRMRSKGFEPGKGGYSKKNRGPTGRERKERTEWEWKEKQRKAKREEEKERREKAQQEEQERKNQETRNQQRREKTQQEEEQKEKEEQRKANRKTQKEKEEREQKEKYDQRKKEQQEQERKNQEKANEANNLRRNWTRDGPQIIQMVKEMNPNIKTIYKQLMMKYHPDKNPNAIEEATRISQELNRIYSEYKKNTRK